MKSINYIFKFIDHNSKQFHCCMITLFCDKKIEWPYSSNDAETLKWMCKHFEWELRLKRKVMKIISNRMFNNDNGDFNDYKLIMDKICKKGDLVNMNTENNNKIYFRLIEMIETCTMKYERGKAPQHWVEIFDYNKIHHSEQYVMTFDMTENGYGEVQLVEKARYNITSNQNYEKSHFPKEYEIFERSHFPKEYEIFEQPHTPKIKNIPYESQNYESQWHEKNIQEGGDYYKKYMKYKKKYNASKD